MPSKVGGGSLRAVTPKTEKHPSYKGSLTIDGRKYWLSGWKRDGDDGKPWLSLTVEEGDSPIPERKSAPAWEADDEIPF
jgi:hypothetical protein